MLSMEVIKVTKVAHTPTPHLVKFEGADGSQLFKSKEVICEQNVKKSNLLYARMRLFFFFAEKV